MDVMAGRNGVHAAGTVGRLAGAMVLLVACSPVTDASRDVSTPLSPDVGTASVTLSDAGCELVAPSEVAAGPFELAMSSETSGRFDVDLWRLSDGHDYEELAEHIAEERRRSQSGEAPLGHPGFATLVAEASAEEDSSGELQAQLEPGTYGLACIHFPTDDRPGALWAAGPIEVSE
jgi:hypothetical protein